MTYEDFRQMIKTALNREDDGELSLLLFGLYVKDLDVHAWQQTANRLLEFVESLDKVEPNESARALRRMALDRIRDLTANSPLPDDSQAPSDRYLEELRAEVRKDRFSPRCSALLRQLRVDVRMSPERKQHLIAVLAEFFTDPELDDQGQRTWNFSMASGAIQTVVCSVITFSPMMRAIEPHVRTYLNWLARRPLYFLVSNLWKLYESEFPDARGFHQWHQELLQSKTLPADFRREDFRLAIALRKERDAISRSLKARWSGWQWPRDVEQYKALLSLPSPLVRANAALVVGALYQTAYEVNGADSVPPLAEILDWLNEEESRGTGVAGAFLQGAEFGMDDPWTSHSQIDIRDWMLRTLAVGPEPEFTGCQRLSFHAHEYLEPSEEILRHLVASGREDAALMLAGEASNHDPAIEAHFLQLFEQWRREGAAN